MRKVVNVPFEVTMSFVMPANSLGVVVRQVSKPEIHHVLLADSLLGGKPIGSVFDVECTEDENGTLYFPANLSNAWIGPIGTASKQIETHYLQYMYLTGLQRVGALETEKSFDPKDVFAIPILVLFENLYKAIVGKDIKEVLNEKNFYYSKRSYYTRFDGDDVDISYNTPRTLRYYPEARLVVATFLLENRYSIPANVIPEAELSKYRGDSMQIQRFYVNEPWLTLRNLCKKDTNVWGLINEFINRGFIKPFDLTKLK